MLDFGMATALEHAHRALHVAVGVGVRCLDAVTDTSLRTEVDYAVEFLPGEELRHAVAVGQIEQVKSERCFRLELTQTRML